MTKVLVFKDFWDIAVRWFGATAEAAEWSHDWCEAYDRVMLWGGESSILEDLVDSLEQDEREGCGDKLTQFMLECIKEVLQ